MTVKVGDKVLVDVTEYCGFISAREFLTVTQVYDNGCLEARQDGDDFEWFIIRGTYTKQENNMTPQEIITNDEIERVHANANFGSMAKRDVVDEAILKAACRFHNGYTAQMILEEHGLVKRATHSRPKMTEKGRKYLYAAYKKTFKYEEPTT